MITWEMLILYHLITLGIISLRYLCPQLEKTQIVI